MYIRKQENLEKLRKTQVRIVISFKTLRINDF